MADLITLPRATVQQALHVATAAGYPVALIAALKAALEQPSPDPVDEYRKGFIDGQIDMRDRPEEQPEQEPVAYLYHDAQSAHDANPMLHSTLLVMATERRPEYRNETPLYTHPPRRETEQEPDHKPDCALLRIPSRDCDCGAEPEPAK